MLTKGSKYAKEDYTTINRLKRISMRRQTTIIVQATLDLLTGMTSHPLHSNVSDSKEDTLYVSNEIS